MEASSSQYASISDGSQTGLDITGDMTSAQWLKFESVGVNTFIARYRTDTSNRAYLIFYDVNQGVLKFVNSSNGSGFTEGTVAWSPTANTWYHVAVTKSGTTATFYINGSTVGTATVESSQFNSNSTFAIGAIVDTSPVLFHDGLADDVRIWARALSGTEIGDLYNAPATFSNGADLKGWWKFDNAYTDASGNGNTLTAQNSPVFSTDVPFTAGTSTVTSNYTYAETNYANMR